MYLNKILLCEYGIALWLCRFCLLEGLAIEHNSLSLEQVTAILDGKRVLGNPNEIKEVQNAYDAYELMLRLDPASVDDLLKAHKLMMNGLVSENGRFRSGGVGVFDGDMLIHMAPLAGFVELMLEIIRDSLTEVTVVGRSTDQHSDQVADQDKTPTERLLYVLSDKTLSATELMDRLGLSHKPTFRKNYLNPALEQNLIERTIPDKPNSRNQKYRKCKN